MKARRRNVAIATVAAAVAATCNQSFGQLAAFPGAVGFGSSTTGARASTASTVYHVTNLNDSGAGSFRDAVSKSNRIVVFDVNGQINIASAVSAQSNLTILGQTAPGDGVAINGAEVSFYGRSNDIVRYLRFRDTTNDPGGQGTGNSSGNCINLGNTTNMIFDHVSTEFASYNNIDAAGTTGANNLTWQNSIDAAPIASQRFNFHWEGTQGTFINNIFVDGHNRSILAKGNTQFVNNTVYNYQAGFTSGNSAGDFSYDVIGNEFITGPSTTSSSNNFYQVDSNQSAYSTGNVRDSNNNGSLDGSTDNTVDGAVVLTSPWSATTATLPKLSAVAAYNWNIAHAGDSLLHDANTFASVLGYDPVDGFMINEVQTLGTAGKLWSSQTQTGIAANGGLGTLAIGTKPTDTDSDGIPDGWEAIHGLSSTTADSTKLNPLGYTEIEQYANEVADSTLPTRAWSATSGEWSTSGNWSTQTPIVYEIAAVQGNGSDDGSVTVTKAGATAYQLYIGGNGAAAGESVRVAGGSLFVLDTIQVGNTNAGVLQIDSGTVTCSNIILGNTLSGTVYGGALALNGGTLNVDNIALGGGSPGAWTSGGTIQFNGGALQAGGTLSVSAPSVLGTNGGTIDANGNYGTISGAISGSGALTVTGNGTINLTGTNSMTGGVVLNSGELGVSTNANLGGPNSTISFNGGVLQIQGTSLTNLGTHAVNFSTFNGGFDIAAAANTFTVAQSLGGSGALSKFGAGALLLTGANSFSGGTTVNGGTLIVSTDSNLGASGGTFNANGGVLRVTGTTLTNTLNHPLSGSFNGGIDVSDPAETFTINQQVNGTGNIAKYGAGTLVLATRSYLSGNLFLNGGAVRIADPLSLRYMTVNLNTAGTTLDLGTINNATIGSLVGTQGFDLKGFNVYVGNDNSSTTYSGAISSSVAGAGGYTKIGTGTFSPTGNSTFTGPVKISAGILSLATLTNGGAASPLGASSSASGNLILDGGTLQYTGAGGTIDRLFDLTVNGGALDASGTAAITYASTAAITPSAAGNTLLTLTGTSTAHNYLQPALGDPTGFKTSVIKTGAGKWSFNGALKTYSGTTEVAGGILETVGANTMSHNSTVIVDSAGVLDFHGTSQMIDALTGSGVVTNSFGTAGNLFTIGANNGSGTFTGNLGNLTTLNIAKSGTGIEVLAGSSTYTGSTTVNSGVLQFNSTTAIGGSGASVTVFNGGAAAAGYAMTQAFLSRITSTSTGAVALAVNSANALDFSSTGANLPNVSLGAVGSVAYTGTLTPNSSIYQLGGGGGTLTLSNANALTGARGLNVNGAGTIVLSATNNFTSATSVGSLSTLTVGSGASLSATTSVSLAGGSTLRLISTAVAGVSINMLPDSSSVILSTNTGSPLVQLDLNGNTETVGSFYLNGVSQPAGTYSASTAPGGYAADEAFFGGNGSLVVLAPEPASFISVTGVLAPMLLKRKRRRAMLV